MRQPAPRAERAINSGALVYGVLAVATVVAAEASRRETYPKVLAASIVTMGLYWLGHSYARHLGTRFIRLGERSLRQLVSTLAHESFILLGAAAPLIVLTIGWGSGVTLETGVTATLWAAGIELVVLELVVGVRRHLALIDMAKETAASVAMGLGILAVRILLH